jgi:hypothetical protein
MPDPLFGRPPPFGHFKYLVHFSSNHHQNGYTLSSTISEHDPGVFRVIKLLCRKKHQSCLLVTLAVVGIRLSKVSGVGHPRCQVSSQSDGVTVA